MSTLDSLASARAALARPERDASPFSIVRREGPWRDALRRRMLAVADLLAAAIATVTAVGLADGSSLVWCLAALPGWILLAKLHGLYDSDHRVLRHLTVDELPTLATWALTGTALFVLAVGAGEQTVTTWVAIKLWVALVAGVVVLRTAARGLWRRIVPPERALLVGSGALERATLRKLELFDDIHVECVATIDDSLTDPGHEASGAALEERILAVGNVDRVIVASTHVAESLIAEQVRLCRRHRLKLSVVPPARGMFGTAVHLHHIADLPLIEYSTWDTPRSSMLLKRVADVAVAAVMLVVLSPVLLAIAAAIRLTSRGPALFVQDRAGIGGRPFRMYKFRTMVLGVVVAVDDLVSPMFKLRRDPRMTGIGRFLRRTSIDELPQLFNVLGGSMSLVGPRPEQVDLVDRYQTEHLFRLQAKPGMTGPMQVYGRGELRFDERLAVEREYVENLSLRRDLRLLLLTISTVVRGRGAF